MTSRFDVGDASGRLVHLIDAVKDYSQDVDVMVGAFSPPAALRTPVARGRVRLFADL